MSGRGIVGVPRVPNGMLDRTGLRDRIGKAPLTIIRAPGGRGKTVLMAQWAAARSGAGTWITVEPDIGSRLSFWSGVISSIAELGPGLRGLTEDGADRDALRFDLLRFFRAIDTPVVLLIDDAHELRDPLVVEDLLALLRSSQNVNAVVGTRTRTELEAPREALTLDVSVIGPDELVFTLDEIERLAGGDASAHLDSAELLRASGGSPLLLRAILAGSTVSPDSESSNVDGDVHAVIVDYLNGLFRKHDHLEQFASLTSVPDDLDLLLAQDLSLLPAVEVATLLESLELEGLVMRRDSAGTTRYRYHPMIRQALRDGLRSGRPERFREASLLASGDAEARKLYIPALRHAVEAEDYMRASDVCLHGGFSLLRSRGAAAILHTVPMRYVARLPFLAVILGLAANARGERLRALELLTLALAASRAWRRSQRPAEQAGLALIESVVLRITGRANDSAAPARRMLAILEASDPVELEEIADQVGAYQFQGALSLFRAGRLSEALVVAERVGISDVALAGGATDSVGAASLVAAVSAALGESRTATTVLARLDAASISVEQRDGYTGALAHFARCVLAFESGDVAAAQRQLDEVGARPNLEYRPLFTTLRAVAALWQEAPEVGLRLLEHDESVDRPRARMTAQDRQLNAAARTVLYASLGQLARSHTSLKAVDRRGGLSVVLHATLLILEQRPDEAIGRITAQTEWQGRRLEAAAELLTAAASVMANDNDRATAALRQFLATAEVHGISTPMILVPAELREPLLDLASQIGADKRALALLRGVPSPLRYQPTRAVLTPREVDVLEELRSTASVSEIAATLNVSTNTVKSQVRTLYRKLAASNRDEALRTAYLQGLLDD